MDGFSTSGYWLATIIVRGTLGSDIHVILDKVEAFGEFGALDRQRMEQNMAKFFPEMKRPGGLVRSSNANVSYMDAEPQPRDVNSPAVAFWLPYDLGPNITAEDAYKDFDDKVFVPLEDLFFRFFGLEMKSTLPNEMLPASLLQQSTGRMIQGKWNS
jgi:hypothetical protein